MCGRTRDTGDSSPQRKPPNEITDKHRGEGQDIRRPFDPSRGLELAWRSSGGFNWVSEGLNRKRRELKAKRWWPKL